MKVNSAMKLFVEWSCGLYDKNVLKILVTI